MPNFIIIAISHHRIFVHGNSFIVMKSFHFVVWNHFIVVWNHFFVSCIAIVSLWWQKEIMMEKNQEKISSFILLCTKYIYLVSFVISCTIKISHLIMCHKISHLASIIIRFLLHWFYTDFTLILHRSFIFHLSSHILSRIIIIFHLIHAS